MRALTRPRVRRVDQHAGGDRPALTRQRIFDRPPPAPVLLPDLDGARTGADFSASIRRITRGENHKTSVVDETVGILEPLGKPFGNQRLSKLTGGKERRGGWGAGVRPRRYGHKEIDPVEAAMPVAS